MHECSHPASLQGRRDSEVVAAVVLAAAVVPSDVVATLVIASDGSSSESEVVGAVLVIDVVRPSLVVLVAVVARCIDAVEAASTSLVVGGVVVEIACALFMAEVAVWEGGTSVVVGVSATVMWHLTIT